MQTTKFSQGLPGEAHAHPTDSSIAESLQKLWQGLFNDDERRFSAQDDFFRIGGSSLLAVAMIENLRTTFGITISLKSLLRHSTFGALAKHLTDEIEAQHRERTRSAADLDQGII